VITTKLVNSLGVEICDKPFLGVAFALDLRVLLHPLPTKGEAKKHSGAHAATHAEAGTDRLDTNGGGHVGWRLPGYPE